MVAKISRGASLYGALAYNYDKVEKGVAEILSGNRIISDRLGQPSADIRLALLSFDDYLSANRNTKKPVLHIAISPAPEDRLTDGQLEELAAKYMEMMGYGGQPYIVFKHGDSHNTHIHIVSVCVDGEGRKISDRYEHRRSMAACRDIERTFGLRNGAELHDSPKTELKKVNVSEDDVRHQVANTLKAVLESYRFQSFGEYSAVLSTLNVEARQVKGEYVGRPYVGVVYTATDDMGKPVGATYKSSRFGKRFGDEGLKKLMQRHTADFKAGKWRPSVQRQIEEAMRSARSRGEFTAMLAAQGVCVVFHENEDGRIYGVTFIDHGRREAFNGSRLGKEYSANVFDRLFKSWENGKGIDVGTDVFAKDWHGRQERNVNGNIIEQAAGALSLETNPATDYEEDMFRRRMNRKKKPGKRRSRGI